MISLARGRLPIVSALVLGMTACMRTPTSNPTSTPSQRLSGELVYTRSGGFVGTNDRVVIQPTGPLESSGRMLGQHSGTLSEAQLTQLVGLLANWSQVTVTGAPPPGAADYFTLSITYAGKTVTWTSLTPNVPAELTTLATTIEQFARSLT